MATTYYHAVDGEIEGQTTAGVRTDYLTVALNSVVPNVNSRRRWSTPTRTSPTGMVPHPYPWPKLCDNPCDGMVWANTIAKGQLPSSLLYSHFRSRGGLSTLAISAGWTCTVHPGPESDGSVMTRLWYGVRDRFCELLWNDSPAVVCEPVFRELAHWTGVSHGFVGGSLIHAIGNCSAREAKR